MVCCGDCGSGEVVQRRAVSAVMRACGDSCVGRFDVSSGGGGGGGGEGRENISAGVGRARRRW